MINNQLAAALKKIGQRFFAVPCIENVFFLDLDPW